MSKKIVDFLLVMIPFGSDPEGSTNTGRDGLRTGFFCNNYCIYHFYCHLGNFIVNSKDCIEIKSQKVSMECMRYFLVQSCTAYKLASAWASLLFIDFGCKEGLLPKYRTYDAKYKCLMNCKVA